MGKHESGSYILTWDTRSGFGLNRQSFLVIQHLLISFITELKGKNHPFSVVNHVFLHISSHGICSRARNAGHAGSGCEISISATLPPLICRLQSEVRGIIFSATQSWWEFGRDWQFESKPKAYLCISVWVSTRSISAPAPTYSGHGNICVMQLWDKSDSAPDSCSWAAISFLFLKHTLKKSVSLSIKANKE